MVMAYILLGMAIMLEVFGSTMLKLSNGFSRLLPALGGIIGFGLAFYLISISLRTLPLGVVYATWSGVGTALTAIVGIWLFQESFNLIKCVGLCLVIIGIVLLNTSKGKANEGKKSQWASPSPL